MNCDALTLAAIANELRRDLLGGRVQNALLVDRLVLGLELYRGRRDYLLISARPEEGGRIHLAADRLRRGAEAPSPLWLRLCKEVEGALLTAVEQPPLERVLHLVFQGGSGVRTLVVEIMGQRSNIALLEEDGTILECARHVAPAQNRYRTLLPGRPYVPPPPQKKANGLALSSARLNELLAAQPPDQPLSDRLVATVFGVSPLLAREIAFRATGNPRCQEADAAAVLTHLQELLSLPETGKWKPSVAVEDEAVVAYAPYSLTQYALHRSTPSTSVAMEAFYVQQAHLDAYAVARATVQRLIDEQRERQLRKRAALVSALTAAEDLDDLRRKGELLLAYAHEIAPRQTVLVARWAADEPSIRIPLDPTLTAVENARAHFRRYEKARSAVADVPGIITKVDGELAHLGQLATDLALAEDRPGLEAVTCALAEAGYVPKPKARRPPTTGPLRVGTPEGFAILVGRNSWQNERLTFHDSDPHDIWLHTRNVPGAHVVIRTGGREVPDSVLRKAAELAAYYSAARQDNKVLVDHTLRRNVRRHPGGRQGQVTCSGEATLSVRPEPEDRS